jgi:hypothetical protein
LFHVGPDLGQQGASEQGAHAGHRLEDRHLRAKGFEQTLDLPVDVGDRRIGRVDLLQVQTKHQPMVRRDAAAQRLDELLARRMQSGARQLHQLHRVGLSGDERTRPSPGRSCPERR